MMTAVLFTVLFFSAAILAAVVLAAGWRRYAAVFPDLRKALHDCDEWRMVEVKWTSVDVHTSARILRPNFMLGRHRPDPVPELTAAA